MARGLSLWAPLALLMPAASCVPVTMAASPALKLSPAEILAFSAPIPENPARGAALAFPVLVGEQAQIANSAIPVASGPNPSANAYVFRASTPLDEMRSHDCLAQAIYYEARSEGEDGERAVAQVVLNRVRHPAWPHSVCGVVYQGPLRVGGGCQFTFTCDGSLAYRPSGYAWSEAQRIATEALGGRTFAAVGLSTHYHTSAVFPAWAPRLIKTAQIGAHIFYRLPGLAGIPAAFANAYAGSEPVPHPAMTIVARAFGLGNAPIDNAPASATAAAFVEAHRPPPPPSDIPQDPRWAPSNLPASQVREEHAQSGQWRADAPAAITGR